MENNYGIIRHTIMMTRLQGIYSIYPSFSGPRVGIEEQIPSLLLTRYIFPYLKKYKTCAAFFPLILDIKFVGRTSRGHTGGGSDRISHPPSFCGACLNFYCEKDSAIPFPRRP